MGPYGDDADWPADQRIDDAGSLVFTTDALAERVEILGAPRLHISFAVDRPLALAAVRLNDVAPDGASTRVTVGVLNLTHWRGHDAPERLEPGRVYDAVVELDDIAHAFPAGHRIAVSVSTSYYPIAHPSPEAGARRARRRNPARSVGRGTRDADRRDGAEGAGRRGRTARRRRTGRPHPTDRFSIMNYLEFLGKTPKDVEPLSLEFYLQYAQWFQEKSEIETISEYVARIDQNENGFLVTFEDGKIIEARNVPIAIGMGYFKNYPAVVTDLLPAGRYEHTCDAVQLSEYKGRRVLILGGRQSAFEWAALLNDGGAAEVHVAHRHESPKFAEADWSWVPPLVDGMVANPAWFRGLPQEEKDAIVKRMWGEGRLKVEPWLEKRVMKPNTSIHQKASSALLCGAQRWRSGCEAR